MTTEHAALQEFTDYFVRNYPGPDTIIHDPKWHAPKIFRAAKRAIDAALSATEPQHPIDNERALRHVETVRVLIRDDTKDWAPAVRDGALIALKHIAAALAATEPQPRTVNEAHWVSIRLKVIAALRDHGFEILSDKDRVWLHRLVPAEPQPVALQDRAIELHEQAGMPWHEAEALALREIGIDDAAIVELQGECMTGAFLCDEDIPAFVRSVLVHGSPLYASPPLREAAPQEPAVCIIRAMYYATNPPKLVGYDVLDKVTGKLVAVVAKEDVPGASVPAQEPLSDEQGSCEQSASAPSLSAASSISAEVRRDAERYRVGAHGNVKNAEGAELGMAWVKFDAGGRPSSVLWVTDQEIDAALDAQKDAT